MPLNQQQKSGQSGQTSFRKTEQCSANQVSVNKDMNCRIQELQNTIDSLRNKLSNYNSLSNDIAQLKSLIHDEESGFVKSLKYVAEQSESNYDDIYFIRQENAQLRSEVDLLRASVIKLDRKIAHQDKELNELRSRSMRDNILIHNFEYTPGELLSDAIPKLIKESLGVQVSFVRIHRNSAKGTYNSRPVTITAKLVDRSKKDEILKAQKARKLEKIRLPFYITSQDPPAIREERKRLYDISDSLRENKIKARVERGRVTLPNGDAYIDPVQKIETSDTLQITPDEIENLDISDTTTEPTKLKGSEIFATGAKVTSIIEVQNLYKKVCVDPYSAAADHRILIYRFVDSSGKIHESYWDDGEHGAGRRLMTYMKTNKIENLGVVITRWCGPNHIGPDRFRIMEDHVCEVANTVL
ncbi:uncharacterized protein LOC125682836 [Ostrea edulis]|uniref:uncharacterized protein LOC125682836 n=1 Tax=Ostrea edulis TaxID=37623 RepID=UPI0024AFABCD|nr:uncharacterized protein LOC125682836 [Ostrea edulis]